MNPAKPLLFLTFRSIWNGLKRAFTTPRRLISLILVLAYYFFIFVRPALGPGGADRVGTMPPGVTPALDFPPLAVIDGVSFGIFSVLSLLMLGGIMSANATFRQADVDVLFTMPISPRVVLTFRILRDYLLTLFVPLFIAILGLKPARLGWEAVFKNMPNPEYSGMALRFMMISWLMMSLSWVVISHAVTLWVNRTDRHADKRRKRFGIALGTFALLVVGYIGLRMSQVTSASDVLAITHTPGLRVVFFMASMATQMTMAPFTPSGPVQASIGAGGMLALIGFFYWLCLRQAGYLYDISAIRVAATSKAVELQRSGDFSGLVAHQARLGKYKGIRLGFISRLKMKGPMALVWKELLLQPRTMISFVVLFALFGTMMSLIPALAPDRRGNIGWLLVTMQAMTVFMVTMSLAQTGFNEVLRRVDLQKPLPFPSWVTVSAEIISKSILAIFVCTFGATVAVIIKPSLWAHGLASLLAAPGFSFMLSACVFLVTMLFPDMEDASQRNLRGLMIMLSIAITGLMPSLAFAGITALGLPPYVGGLAAGLLSLGIAIGLNVLSGKLYESFNPSE